MAAICKRQQRAMCRLSHVRRLPSLVLNWEERLGGMRHVGDHKAFQLGRVHGDDGECRGRGYGHPGARRQRNPSEGRGVGLRLPVSAVIAVDHERLPLDRQRGGLSTTPGGGQSIPDIPPEVEEAVKLYERRRPRTPPWHEIGIVPAAGGGAAVIDTLEIDRRSAEVKRIGASTPTVYRMHLRTEAEISDVLDPYKKAIEAQSRYALPRNYAHHGGNLQSHWCHLPQLDRGRQGYEFTQDPEDREFASRLDHFLKVHQMGVRFAA